MAFFVFNLGIFLVIMTRYLSIYHSTLLASIPEDDLIKWFKILLITAPMLSSFFEFTYVTDLKELVNYPLFKTCTIQGEVKTERMSIVIIVINLLSASILYVRMELDYRQFDEESGLMRTIRQCWTLDQEGGGSAVHGSTYKLNILRVIFFILIFLIGVIFYHFSTPNDVMYSFLIYYIIGFGFCPWLFVLNHENMRMIVSRLLI